MGVSIANGYGEQSISGRPALSARVFYCAKCTCCVVKALGDLCIFCEDGILCPRQRNLQRLAKVAAGVLARPSREERAIRKGAKDVEKRAAREARDKLRQRRLAEKKMKRISDVFISSLAAAEVPDDDRRRA